MHSVWNKNTLTILKYLILIYIAVMIFPVTYLPMTSADETWEYSLNYMAQKHIKFGADVAWTYGPLGYLVHPIDIGSNLAYGILFQLSLWALFIGALAYMSYRGIFTASRLFFLLLSFLGALYLSPDYLICMMSLFFISLAVVSEKRWPFFYGVAASLTVLLFFVKFSSAVLSLSSMVVLIPVAWLLDRRKTAAFAAITFIGVPALFAAAYLLYNPSLTDMAYYIKNAIEITSGYSVAMSIPGRGSDLALALLVVSSYAVLMTLLYRYDRRAFAVSVISTAPLFVAFKHGFVRHDAHVIIFFSFALFVFGLVFLFTDPARLDAKKISFIIAVPIVSLFAVAGSFIAPDALKNAIAIPRMKQMLRLTDMHGLRTDLSQASAGNLKPLKLPPDILELIAHKTVGIFTIRTAYAAANGLNYVPFPVIMTYSAYTPYLDMLNASFLEDNAKAPELILMEWVIMYRRHQLADVPAMWLSIYKWYDPYVKGPGVLILKRRPGPRFTKLEFIEKREYNSDDIIDVPLSNSPVVANIKLTPNIKGRLARVFYKVPEVGMESMTGTGLMRIRVVPENLGDGLMINYLPMDLNDVDLLLSGNRPRQSIRDFRLVGRGAGYYNKRITVSFYKVL